MSQYDAKATKMHVGYMAHNNKPLVHSSAGSTGTGQLDKQEMLENKAKAMPKPVRHNIAVPAQHPTKTK